MRELRRDPVGFARALVAPEALDRQSRRLLWAMRLGVPAASVGGFSLGVLLYLLFIGPPTASAARPDAEPQMQVTAWAAPPSPRSDDTPGGGGGGGNHDLTPVSRGRVPPSSMADPVVTATVRPVPPSTLPVPPPLKAPSVPDVAGAYGDPSSTSDAMSDGPGSGGGAGDGDKGGWGPGPGRGIGPGNDSGTGDGPGGPGRGPRAEPATPVATRARILNNPRPAYTELARKNKTEGTVRLTVLLGADGRVHRATVISGLPDGLNERAIEAVQTLAFEPARNTSGNPIDSVITVTVRFAIR